MDVIALRRCSAGERSDPERRQDLLRREETGGRHAGEQSVDSEMLVLGRPPDRDRHVIHAHSRIMGVHMRPYRRQHIHLNYVDHYQQTEDSKARRCSPAAFGGFPPADPTAIPTHALSEELSGTTKIISHAFAGMIPFDSRFTVFPPSGLHGSIQDGVSLRRSTT